MKFAHTQQAEPESVPMAPLIDIVFLMLVYFMVTSVYSTMESEIDIILPTSSTAELDERMQGEIFINLREDGQIVLNGHQVNLEELQEILDRVSEHFPGGSVIIRGDRKAELGRAIAILDTCRNADIQNISFAALQEGVEEGL
ncbi:MAG: biopolymer transporter ExbD [Candidatus Hydrogenedentes bacterium]|nr:biopolymer transporter ExbD [Candidatus Hydrogenedentota bacterium]